MTGSRVGTCEWCGAQFERTGRGPVGVYCSAAHRQAAHRARQATTPLPDAGELAVALDDLAAILAAPGQFAQYALWSAARQILRAAGRHVDEPDDTAPAERPVNTTRPRVRVRWEGDPLPRPASAPARRYVQEWTGDRWEVRVIPLRNGKPAGKGSALWRRQHRDRGQDVYRWVDPWGVFDSTAVHRLAAALIVDALDIPEKARTQVTRRSDLGHIAGHLTGDVLLPLAGIDGDQAWAVDSSELTAWLELHRYLHPVRGLAALAGSN